VTAVPLRRNRDFLLLQTGTLLSSAGSQMTAVAYPLLVLALTGSPAKAGIVAFARLLAMALFALPAGLVADHWNRRRLMIAAHAVRALVIGRFQEERERDRSSLRSRFAEGFRFLWDHPFLRTCAFLYGLSNFVGPGVLLAVVVIGERQGLSGGEIGLLLSAFGAGLVLGAFLSPLVRRVLPVRGVLLLELWTWVGCGLFLVWPNVYVLTASILPTALAIPSTDSVVTSHQLAMTPDRLIGRVESVRSTIALLIAPLGPLTAGLLLDVVSERATIAVFAVFGLVLALWGTLSPAIRAAPSLDELAELPARA
jgi:MFS family permease